MQGSLALEMSGPADPFGALVFFVFGLLFCGFFVFVFSLCFVFSKHFSADGSPMVKKIGTTKSAQTTTERITKET